MPDISQLIPVSLPNEPVVTANVYREMGVNDSEYRQIVQTLGRTPTYTEIGMYSVLWSEHCGYKYSRPVLKRFAEYRKAQESGELENAGVVKIGDTGWGIAFKMESHNHPSAVEPYQGAATGVGGILRDIFTVGARPIALLNSLRFGNLETARNRYLFEHVVRGIGDYGNCVGVPTVGGEVFFHPCYDGNPLVNALAAGIVRLDHLASAKAVGVGNAVVYFGNTTGRDGIHGATFASVELTAESEAKRPNVQVGDPFTEKLLIEATLEALATGKILAIQDMGAAGLSCATSEMAAKGDLGMDVDVQTVPRRETNMSAYEVMLSESQERMLAVVGRDDADAVRAVFTKWGLVSAVIGFTTDTGNVVVRDSQLSGANQIVANIPAKSLADDCPVYHLTATEPAYFAALRAFDVASLPDTEDYGAVLLRLLSSPNIASKRWVWEQYDHTVQTQTVLAPGRADAAVLHLKEVNRAIALTTDCNPRLCYLDPFAGAQLAVMEAARNLSCVGATPAAVTDCLNFASPERPEGFWQFGQCVDGLATACEALGTPVVSGNVSFYNETPTGAVYPTPAVGMVGVFDEGVTPCQMAFQSHDALVYLLRPQGWDDETGLGGSEYLSIIHQTDAGRVPTVDLAGEIAVQKTVRAAIAAGVLQSAHDCAEGGLLVAIAESCIAASGNVGVELRFAISDFGSQSWTAICFGESASRIVVSVAEGAPQERLLDIAEANGIEAIFVGQVKHNGRLDAPGLVDIPVADLRAAYENAIPHAMQGGGSSPT